MKTLKLLVCVAVVMMMMVQVAGAAEYVKAMVQAEANYEFKMETNDVGGKETEKNTYNPGGLGQLRLEGRKEAANGLYIVGQSGVKTQLDNVAGWDKWLLIGKTDAWSIRMLDSDRLDSTKKGEDFILYGTPGVNDYNGKWLNGKGASFHFPMGTMKPSIAVQYDNGSNMNNLGVRPHMEMAAGPATILGAVEYLMGSPQDPDAKGQSTKFGASGNVEVKLSDMLSLGGGAAYGVVGGKDSSDKDLDDATTLSAFVYAKLGVAGGTIGLGAGYNANDKDIAGYKEITGMRGYVSFIKPLIEKKLEFKVGASYASSDLGDDTKDVMGAKVMFKYNSGWIEIKK